MHHVHVRLLLLPHMAPGAGLGPPSHVVNSPVARSAATGSRAHAPKAVLTSPSLAVPLHTRQYETHRCARRACSYRPFLVKQQPPTPLARRRRCAAAPPQGDLDRRRGRACRRRCDDSELGEPVTNLQLVPVEQGSGGRVVYIMLGASRKQVLLQLLGAARGK